MDKILPGIENVMCFVDDILVTGNTEQEHLKTLEQVLQKLEQYNVRLNKAKCQFMKSQVPYMGHTVNANGIQHIQDKVEAIRKAPPPTNLTELQSFLGVVQYYAKFVPNLSTVLRPLYERLKVGVEWSWDSSCDEAFNQCKSLISSETVLTHYDGSKPLILATDAAIVRWGGKPIAFASRTLCAAERNYSQIEREALGIIFGVKKMPPIPYGAIIHHEDRSSSIDEDIWNKDWHTVYIGSVDATLGVGISRVF